MIKKLLTVGAVVLSMVLGASFLPPVEAQRGHAVTAPKYTTANLPTCSTAINAGRLAWDTTTTSFKVCDGSAWVESGTFGGTSISGTNNTVPVFNSAGTNIEDSLILDDGTTITLGNAVLISSSEAAANFTFSDTSANLHYPAAGALTVSAGGATPSILFDGSTENFKFDTDSIANTDAFIFEGTMPLTAAGQESALLNLTFISGADHTGGSVFALDVRGITGDANAEEIGIIVRSGWDQAIRLDDGSATDDTITFGASADAEIYWDNANGRFAIDATDAATGGSVRVTWSDVDGNGLQLAQASTLVHTFAGLLSTTFTNPANMVNLGLGGTIGNMDGTDTWNVLRVDVVNGNHTGDTNTLNLLFLDAIAGDAEANLNAILIGALTGTAPTAGEVETAINIGAGWDHSLSILADGSATDDNIALGAAQDARIYYTGSVLTLDVDEVTAGSDIRMLLDSCGTCIFVVDTTANANFLQISPTDPASSNHAFVNWTISAMAEADSDELDFMTFDLNDAEFDTAGGSTFNFINIETFTPDDNVIYNGLNIAAITGGTLAETAINIGSGWDTGLHFDDDLVDYMTFEDGNGSVRNFTGTTSSYNFPGNQPSYDTNSSGFGTTANEVYVWRFYLPYRLTVSRLAFRVANGETSASCAVGVYDAAGTTLLINTGAVACATNTTVIDTDVTDLTIGPGFYIMAFTSDDGLVTYTTSDSANNTAEDILNATVRHNGVGANASSVAVLPAAVGAISTTGSNLHPIVKLQSG